MAGEVKSQLTITLAGGVGASGGGSATDPVARRGDLMSPAQAMSNFAGDRRSRWTRAMAMEAARDSEVAREFEKARLRSDVGEIASAVRAAEAREAFKSRVRAGPRPSMFGDEFSDPRTGRRAIRSGAAASKRLLKGWGIGVAAGLTSGAIMPGEDSSGFGAFARIGLATVSGAAFGGGVPGAVAAAIASSIAELTKLLSEAEKGTEELRKALADSSKDLRKAIEDSENRMREFKEELTEKFEVEINRIENDAKYGYREERFHRSMLVQ